MVDMANVGALLKLAESQRVESFIDRELRMKTTKPVTADQIIQEAADCLKNRAATRDSPNGERSMSLCVKTFNALKGTRLTERDGWQFMELLKMARAEQGAFSVDDYVDGAAYAVLAGECASKGK